MKARHHIEWIDLSRNCFSNNFVAVSTLYNGLKCQKQLYHFAIDCAIPKEKEKNN